MAELLTSHEKMDKIGPIKTHKEWCNIRKVQVSRNQRIHLPRKVENVSEQLTLPVDVASVEQAFATANDKRFKYTDALDQRPKRIQDSSKFQQFQAIQAN